MNLILEEAKTLYQAGQQNWRDTRIRVGWLLHQYILSQMQELDGLTKLQLRGKPTRTKVIKSIAETLGTTRRRVSWMVATAMVVNLLADSGQIGGLCYNAILRFQVFIQRKGMPFGRKMATPITTYSLVEEWQVKEKYAETGLALFRQAVAGDWTEEKVFAEVNRLFAGDSSYSHRGRTKPRQSGRKNKTRDCKSFQESRAATVASPGDVVEMCLEIIETSADPRLVVRKLLPLLDEILARKRRTEVA